MPDREYFNNRRKNRRGKFIDLLGGKCERCGGTEGLQFDHRSPNKKEFRIADRIDAPEDILLKEVMKCVLMCAQCHREKTRERGEHGQPKARHGTLWMYKRYGCRCKKCKQHMSEYNKERRMLLSAMESGMKLEDLANKFKKLAEEEVEMGVLKPSEEERSPVDKTAELMNLIIEQSMGDPTIAEMVNKLAKTVEEQDFPAAFDILKTLAPITEKKTHGTLIELAHTIANIRNQLKLEGLEEKFEEEG